MADDKRLLQPGFKYIEEYFNPRLIEVKTLREKFIDYVRSPSHFHWGDWPDMCIRGTEIDEVIANTPTVDAVPVVHGKMRHVFFSYQNNHYECTCCNATFLTNSAPYWRYCPNCGAKMDIKEEQQCE